MNRFKLVGLALLAACALSATASSAASASEAEFTVETTGSPKGGASTLETAAGSKITATELTGETSPTSKKLGLLHLRFRGVKLLGGPCTGAGDLKEEVLVLGEYHVVLVTLPPHVYLLWLLIPQFHFTCVVFGANQLILVRGNVLVQIEPANAKEPKTTKFKLEIKQEKGKQLKYLEFENEKKEKTKAGGLEASSNEGKTFEGAGQQTEKGELETAKATELIN